MKDIELRLISELLKNSRRSDRELAKALGISQPTVSRLIKKLQEEGIIKEFTIIPDLGKLGYKIMSVSFVKGHEDPAADKEFRETITKIEHEFPYANLTSVKGEGMGKDWMFITLFKDYSSYAEGMKAARQVPHVNVDSIESFLVDLNFEQNFRILSMLPISRNILQNEK